MLARRDEFFHTTKVRGITYRKRRTPTNTQLLLYQLLSHSCQLKSQPDFPLICLMNISADKPATWHSSPEQCVVRERSRVLATVMHMCMHMYIQLQCSCCCYSIVNAFSYCLFTLLSPQNSLWWYLCWLQTNKKNMFPLYMWTLHIGGKCYYSLNNIGFFRPDLQIFIYFFTLSSTLLESASYFLAFPKGKLQCTMYSGGLTMQSKLYAMSTLNMMKGVI